MIIKINTKIAMTMLAASSLVSCSQQVEEIVAPAEDGKALEVTSVSLSADVDTRGIVDNKFEAGDRISIYVLDQLGSAFVGGDDPLWLYENTPYQLDDNGKFVAATDNTKIVFREPDKSYQLLAIYPYSVMREDPSLIETDTQDQDAQSQTKYDILRSRGLAISSSQQIASAFNTANFKAFFPFRHIMAQLEFQITVSEKEGFDASEAARFLSNFDLTISGLVHQGEYNALTNDWTLTGDANDWSFARNKSVYSISDQTLTLTMLMIPQWPYDCVLKFTYDGILYQSKPFELELYDNYKTVVPVRVTKTGIEIAEVEIQDWEDFGVTMGSDNWTIY